MQAELEKTMQSLRVIGMHSARLFAPDGKIVAYSGTAALPAQLEATLNMPGENYLRWSNGWSFVVRSALARNGRSVGVAEFEMGLSALEKLFTTVQHAGALREFLLCVQPADRLLCFPSHIQPDIIKMQPRPDGRIWPAAMALRGEQGVTVLSDTLGYNVMAAYAPVGKTGLAAVEKIRISELFGPLQRELFYAFLALILFCIGGSFVLYWQVQPIVHRMVRLQADMGAVLDNVPTGIVWIDWKRRILGANSVLERMFGHTQEELAGRDLAELIPALILILSDGTAAGEQPPRVSQGMRCDGAVLHIEFALSEYSIDGGKRFACIVKDVGEREEALKKLRHWGLIFERARWGVVIGNADAKVIDTMNPEFARMHGYTVEELTGSPIIDVFAPEVRAEVPEHVRRIHELGHYQYESLHVRKDGTTFPVLIDATTVRDERGQVQFRVVNVLDITERKQQEEALRRSEALIRKVLETLPVGVWIADKEGKIVMGNEAGQRIWCGSHGVDLEGYDKHEGWWADTGKKIEPQEWALARAVTRGEISLGEIVRIRCFDGSYKTILNSAKPLLGPDGAIEGAIVVNEDITERQRADEELRISKELFQTTFDSASVGIALSDLEGHFLLMIYCKE